MSATSLQVLGSPHPDLDRVLTNEARAFVAKLHRKFNPTRLTLLTRRSERQARIDRGELPMFLPETAEIRSGGWMVAPCPKDLEDRRVEITGPVERKMMINALNSGARVFMGDFEDSLSPTWENVIAGQGCCMDAVRRTLAFRSPEGKEYRLNSEIAVLLVRPRGWHLPEEHVRVAGEAVSGSLFDFGLYFFHNAKELLKRGSGPYFYLPKMESHLEARLWNDVFCFAQDELGIPRGTVRATVLIETILAAFEMDEILYELRDHMAGLNAGRWDYMFSVIKKFRNHPGFLFPDRAQVTMTVPFMRAYSELLVRTCHRRGAHAMGGMAAFIPSRKDAKVNEIAIAKVREDKLRETRDGFDGTWVAHPDLVLTAKEIFDQALAGKPNQKDKLRADVSVEARQLIDTRIEGGKVTLTGLENNVNVALQYLESWLRGVGAAAIHNLMEDAATAEISRAALWQWIRHGARMEDGRVVTAELYREVRERELSKLGGVNGGRFKDAVEIMDGLVLGKEFSEFLTLPAYAYLSARVTKGADMGRDFAKMAEEMKKSWAIDARWKGIKRDYSAEDVVKLRPSIKVEYSLARRGSDRLWELMHKEPYVNSLGALNGSQAVQMVKAGLKSIYLSGWQVAADANLAGQTYPDQSLYPANSVPAVVRRLNNALMRADQIEASEGKRDRDWYVPILADAEAGFGGPLHAFELMKGMIEAGAAAVHFEDQLAAEKKCGHLGGKVLVPTSQFIRTLVGARLAADVCDVPTLIVARTDALGAALLTSDIDPRDKVFCTGERTAEGFFRVKDGLEPTIARGLAYAPYADVLWFETSKPDLEEAKRFAQAVHDKFPGKFLAYNCSPSFNWRKNLDDKAIARFQAELGALGYKYQFITLAGWHAINMGMFKLAEGYAKEGMPAYVRLQEEEFAKEKEGYTAARHQREVGTGYFDTVLMTISGGQASTAALKGSTEADQFEH